MGTSEIPGDFRGNIGDFGRFSRETSEISGDFRERGMLLVAQRTCGSTESGVLRRRRCERSRAARWRRSGGGAWHSGAKTKSNVKTQPRGDSTDCAQLLVPSRGNGNGGGDAAWYGAHAIHGK